MVLTSWLAGMAIAGFASASFLFALAESALFSLGKWRAERLAESAGPPGRRVLDLLKEPQDVLAAIVLGNTFANAGVVGMAVWISLRGDWPILPTLSAALLLVLVLCEVVPKTLAVRSPEKWSMRLVWLVQFWQRITRLLREVAQDLNLFLLRVSVPQSVQPQTKLTDEEYQELLEMAYQQGTLGQSEKELILQIINLDQQIVKEVMKPRAHMDCISDDLTTAEMIEAARAYQVRRIPLYDEDPDTIVGILNVRTFLLDPKHDLAEAVEFPSFVPETMNLLQLLKSFQRQKRGLAIVLDEFGSTAGVVTMEDILEEVVGELRREGQPEGFVIERLDEGRWRVNGTMRLEDFRREYPNLAEVPEVETMAGLLVNQLGFVPEPGQSVFFSGLRLTAHLADERRVRELVVEVLRKRKGE